MIGELGYLSDRNFLEQYYQSEFFQGKDVETLAYIKQQQQNWAWTATVSTDFNISSNPSGVGYVDNAPVPGPRLNEFENTTEWLPRGDVYKLGEPLFDGWLTWSTHTSAGYAQLHQADAPFEPGDVFVPLPYFKSSQGAVLMTRHELDAPFNIGPVKVVPYAMGEAAYWGEGLDGNSIDRLFINAGVRSTMEMSKVFPDVSSEIFNLNGLAHRVLFEANYSWTDATRDISDIAQYNEFDDNAQERFRERLVVNTFGGTLPPMFDPRFYAIRTGAAYSVTAPYYELVEDQEVVRLAIRQRLQTKEGPPDHVRIRDWMTLDVEASYFPDANRDDFGAKWGLLTVRYAWNISPRTSILANATYDFFANADQLWNIGILSQRSERGSVYLGLYQVKIDGILDSDILTASYSYQMSSKWISTVGTAYDIGEHRNAGQSFTITRVGLDFLFHVGANYDVSTGDVSFAVSVEPRHRQYEQFHDPVEQPARRSTLPLRVDDARNLEHDGHGTRFVVTARATGLETKTRRCRARPDAGGPRRQRVLCLFFPFQRHDRGVDRPRPVAGAMDDRHLVARARLDCGNVQPEFAISRRKSRPSVGPAGAGCIADGDGSRLRGDRGVCDRDRADARPVLPRDAETTLTLFAERPSSDCRARDARFV